MFRSVFSVFLVVLVLVANAGAQGTAARNEPGVVQFLLMQPRSSIPYRIEATNPNGLLGIRMHLPTKMSQDMARGRMSRQVTLTLASWLTEGYFLGFTGPPMADNRTAIEDIWRGTVSIENLVVCRIEVKDVGTNGAATIQVGPDAVKHLAVGASFVLVRPLGATTTQLRATPDFLPVTDHRGQVAGMSFQAATQLNRSVYNAKQIGLAMHNFHDVHKCFPPAVVYGPDGKPWHSWRVLLLPFLAYQTLYDRYRFDEPWDGPNNKKLIKEVPSVYRDPVYGRSDDGYTHYAVAVGAGTAFAAAGYRIDKPRRTFVAAQNMGTSFRRFRDGTSNTILAGSVSPDRKIPWSKPEDIVFDDDFPGIGKPNGFAAPYRTSQGAGGVFLRADGSVTTIRADVDPQLLRDLVQIDDGHLVGEIPTLRRERSSWFQQALVLEIAPHATSARLVLKNPSSLGK